MISFENLCGQAIDASRSLLNILTDTVSLIGVLYLSNLPSHA